MVRILFVDVRNTARSRMAEVWFNREAVGWGKAESCGTMLSRTADSRVTEVMREIDVQIPERTPRPLNQQLLRRADLVVILGKELNTQAFGSARVWDLPDPTNQSLEHYRLVRDVICEKVEQLIAELKGVQVELC